MVDLIDSMELTSDDLLHMSPVEAKKVFSVPEIVALHKFRIHCSSSGGKIQRTDSKATLSGSVISLRIHESDLHAA